MESSISDTHEWRQIEDFQVSDAIHRWGDDLPVLEVKRVNDRIILTYQDTDNQLGEIIAQIGAEFIAHKR